MARAMRTAALSLRSGTPVAILILLAVPALLGLRSADESAEYVRFVSAGKDAGRLETAIVDFEGPGGAKVHLVAAIHIADKAYYDELSRTFELYDALLYELVKPSGDGPAGASQSMSFLSMFQRWMKDTLGLQFQLDAIDYTRPNFIHADMDLETFEKLQKERGEGFLALLWRAVQADLKRQARGDPSRDVDPMELIKALFARDRSRSLKLLMGRQLQDIEEQVAGLEGEKGSVILTERNKVAFQVLRKTLAAGKKDIGIFYGGAHMPDLERRITKDLGFVRKDVRWLSAWDMPPVGGWPKPPEPVPDGKRKDPERKPARRF